MKRNEAKEKGTPSPACIKYLTIPKDDRLKRERKLPNNNKNDSNDSFNQSKQAKAKHTPIKAKE